MIRVEKIIPGGYGLGTLDDGKKIFFWNTLPNEQVEEYKITKSKSHFIEAIAIKISEISPYRCEPQDPCYLSTSPWQIINYDYELKLKQSLVVEIFREHNITIQTPEIFTDHRDYFYRNKMEYALYWDNDKMKISLAFHQRGLHRKIPIEKSSIERSEIFSVASAIVDNLNAHHDEARKYQSLLLRCDQQGKVSGGLFENNKPHPHFENLADTILGHQYSYSPNGFFQINLPVYEMALTEIKKHITTDNVLDLYAGVGTIGLSVARDKNLTLVECDKSAFGEMTRNIAIEGLPEAAAEDERLSPVKTGAKDATRNGNISSLINPLDIWILSRLHQLRDEVTEGMNEYNIPKALEGVLPFIDDLSNWFVRRSRRRFSKNDDQQDKEEAFWTLYTALVETAEILAPFTPFLSEELYQKMTDSNTSVHLLDYPKSADINTEILDQMSHTRQIITDALAIRMRKSDTEDQIKVRQPLSKLIYPGDKLPDFYEQIIAEEVNVKKVENGSELTLDKTLTDDLKREGYARDLIRAIQTARKNAKLSMDDKIKLSLSIDLPKGFEELVKSEAKAAEFTKNANYAHDEITKIGNENITISLEKI